MADEPAAKRQKTEASPSKAAGGLLGDGPTSDDSKAPAKAGDGLLKEPKKLPEETPEEKAAREATANAFKAIASMSMGDNGASEEEAAPKLTAADLEQRCGMRCFISPTRIAGILKHRYTDFLVNEVREDGTVVELSSFEVPEDPAQSELEIAQGGVAAEVAESTVDSLLDFVNPNLATQEDRDAVAAYVAAFEKQKGIQAAAQQAKDAADGDADATPEAETLTEEEVAVLRSELLLALVTDVTKDARKGVHKALQRFGLDTKTETAEDGSTSIIAKPKRGKGKGGKRKRGNDKLLWASRGGEYLRFVMEKQNLDTNRAIDQLCKALHIQPKRLSFAGTKDKRAVTTQLVHARFVHAKTLAKMRPIRGLRVGNYSYVDKHLDLGELGGNRFGLVIRDVDADEETIMGAVASFKETGFINYFGLQRFGVGATGTHEIGRLVLQSKWKEVVDTIIGAPMRDNERGDVAHARAMWRRSGDPKQTLALLPRFMSLERSLLMALKKNGTDYLGAFGAIPRNTRKLYVHAYQSYWFNHAASTRVENHGPKVVVGDLVRVGGWTGPARMGEYEVAVVTADTLGDYTINDVVLPVPGTNTVMPDLDDIKAVYGEALSADGIDLSVAHNNREYHLTGDYRPVFARATDVVADVIRYDDPAAELQLTGAARADGQPEPVSVADGEFMALRIAFTLQPGTYATMALREIMQMDTDTRRHSDATKAHSSLGKRTASDRDENGDEAGDDGVGGSNAAEGSGADDVADMAVDPAT